MLKDKLKHHRIILASKSPRRQFLLKELGLDFEVWTKEVDESFPKKLKGRQIALYLCKKKAKAFKKHLKPNDLIITADTIVCIQNKILNKPRSYGEAVNMLKLLSGKTHTVYTGICITSLHSPLQKQERGSTALYFVVTTKVLFKKLNKKEIDFYIRNYKPYDKAGSYGAQECLPFGMNPCSAGEKRFLRRIKNPELFTKSNATKAGAGETGIIKKITGSYFNVMGLPVKELYEALEKL